MARMSEAAKATLESATCMSDVLADTGVNPKPSPLLTVMKYYEGRVLPACRDGCSCHITFLNKKANGKKPTYSVHVSCVGLGLKLFPKMPEGTTAIVLSNNSVCTLMSRLNN